MPDEGRPGNESRGAAGHIESLAVAIDVTAQARQQRVGVRQVGAADPRQVVPRQRRLSRTHRQAVIRDHTTGVIGAHPYVLPMEAELNVVTPTLISRIVGEREGVGIPALRLKLVDRIGVSHPGEIVLAELLAGEKVAISHVEAGADFIGQTARGRPPQGSRQEMRVSGIRNLRDRRVVVLEVGPVRIVAIPEIRSADRELRRDVIVDLARNIVAGFIVPLVEAISRSIQTVAHQGVVDEPGAGNLVQQALHDGIDRRNTPE